MTLPWELSEPWMILSAIGTGLLLGFLACVLIALFERCR